MKDKSIYPRFLITVLNESNKIYVKESCCRMMIKLFGSKNEVKSVSGDGEGDTGKIEFIKLIEPLISVIYHQE